MIVTNFLFFIPIHLVRSSSSATSSSSFSTSEGKELLDSQYDKTERNAIKSLFRLHKVGNKDDKINPITTTKPLECGSMKNPHTMRCPHWNRLTRLEKQKHRSRLRALVIPDRIRILKNKHAKEIMRKR